MRITILYLFLILSFIGKTQSNYEQVSFSGIGNIKLGMNINEVEKVIGQPVKLHKSLLVADFVDTVEIGFKNIDLTVIFMLTYNNEQSHKIVVNSIKSRSSIIKTKSGIGIGNDKCKIVSTYQGFEIKLYPEYENDNSISKIRSTIVLADGFKLIIFSLINNRVDSMEVTNDESVE